ncbi:hypothetical protein LTR78_005473 [Recurvomyces mirabilis]|uniref:molybdopterin adenylyltransferase n=1 Tax=Recurvomyces mirabilis TaxID=574656 RepID=A0AAE0WN13_9PEZI|nr:hypothetical protein LTR78_005473 [Recurvomyces mirabilis]KAK5152619.1 hypothetical protein LTS14_008153 [Recurvomyces mirabilis]
MATSFNEARDVIAKLADERSGVFAQDEEIIALEDAVGRTVRTDIHSPLSTPTFDSAAVEGYAVVASQVSSASPRTPMRLRCMGTIRPGDRPLEIHDTVVSGYVTCVEIFVGAPFPTAQSTKRPYDAIVIRDHATIVEEGGGGRIIQIARPPLTSWHKRIAGSDFRQNEVILSRGTSVAPRHIMALASVGIRQISVTRLVRIGVVSIGSEIASTVVDQQALQYRVPDADGPYLAAALREMGEDALYWGVLPSNGGVLAAFLRDKLQNEQVDIIVTTGGVSRGRESCLIAALQQLGASTHIDSVAMQPGSSAMLASIPDSAFESLQRSRNSNIRFQAVDPGGGSFVTPPKTPGINRKRSPLIFGLPGSPIASACCFRFLVTPYIRALVGMYMEQEILARVSLTPEPTIYQPQSDGSTREWVVKGSQHYDIFRHAILRSQHDGVSVELARERSIAKASPFVSSNCWLHVRREHAGVSAGDTGNVYPFCSPKS